MQQRIVIAPDSFKGTLDARRVAEALATGWGSVRPEDTIALYPQADGGEGTLDAISAALPAAERRIARGVTGPDGRPVDADWLLLPDGTAVLELAASSGLPLMAAPDPLGATTRGLGEVVAAALAAGATRLRIGLGGSASTDAGAGALAVVPRVDVPVELLTDVTSPLLGPRGAAAVFGPQKGADATQVEELERRLAAYAAATGGDTDAPGAGAAGGTGYGLATAWGAVIRPGAEMVSALTGLDAALRAADVVLTGEGRFDSPSLQGKVVGRVLDAAGDARRGIVAGSLQAGPLTIAPPCWAVGLDSLSGSRERAMADPAHWLRVAGAEAAHALGPQRFAPVVRLEE